MIFKHPSNDRLDGLILRLSTWLLPLMIALCAGAGLRLWEVPQWNRPDLTVSGEVRLSKHDGYGWMAGAKQINQHSSTPFSTCIRILHRATGMPLDRIAFWLPAVMAPLAALPVCLLAIWWGIPEAGMVAGIMAGSSIGYFIRTRVTCLDTDIITLLFPLCLAAGMIMWIESMIPQPRGRDTTQSAAAVLSQAFLLGLLYRCYIAFYPSGMPVGLSIIGMALLIGLIFSSSRHRLLMTGGILMVFLVGDGLWQEICVSAGVVLLTKLRPNLLTRKSAGIVLVLFLLVVLYWFSDLGDKVADIWFHISRYGRTIEIINMPGLPPVINSVTEAQPVNLDGAVFFLAGNWPLFIAGIAGFAIVVWKHPATLVLLPLIALGIGSLRLGIRFTMYGGAVMGVGLAAGAALLLRGRNRSRWLSVLVQLILLIAVCWPIARTADAVNPEPVISAPLAGALQKLKPRSAPDAQVWIWWDKGYEVQYYSERMTLTDGYRNSAEDIFPQAYVHTAASPLSAYQMMVRCMRLSRATGPVTDLGSRRPIFPNPFVNLIRQKSPVELFAFLYSLKHPKVAWSHDLPEQYLVLTWDDLKRAHTILSYGRWDFLNAAPGPGTFIVIRERARIDMKTGIMKISNRSWQLSSKDMIKGHKKRHVSWPEKNGWHALEKSGDRDIYLMDDAAYQMMMVQMLIGEPRKFQPYFDLIIDDFPVARIYRINPILTALPPGSVLPGEPSHAR